MNKILLDLTYSEYLNTHTQRHTQIRTIKESIKPLYALIIVSFMTISTYNENMILFDNCILSYYFYFFVFFSVFCFIFLFINLCRFFQIGVYDDTIPIADYESEFKNYYNKWYNKHKVAIGTQEKFLNSLTEATAHNKKRNMERGDIIYTIQRIMMILVNNIIIVNGIIHLITITIGKIL